MKKWITRTIILICFAAVVFLIVFQQLNSRIRYNDTMVNGNFGGNLYNGGLFCEHNGKVYFSNPDDSMALYSMDPDGNHLRKINNDRATYINVDDHYLYYVRNNTRASVDMEFFSFNNNSLCRTSLKGGKINILDDDPCLYASLFGNSIYYLHNDKKTATTLYKVGIDGKDRGRAKDSYLFTCCALDRYFYYNDPASGNLYQYDTSNDSTSLVLECNCYKPLTTDGTNFYYIDAENNHSLVHVDISSGSRTVLTEESVDCFTVYGSSVFYQTYGDSPALYYVSTGGGVSVPLRTGTFTYLNVTSYYLYFMEYGTEEFYYASVTNPTQINTFHPGKAK